ncbi:MAG: endonuclease VII domain-containing protein [Ktedonobacterales bacterium]|nr:endonuclease VII domain-containing protein [Ktedonobacterales bacterium]
MKTKPGPPGKPLEPTRACHRCGIEKPIEEYIRSVQRASGYQGTCKACIYERRKQLADGKPLPSRLSKSVPGSTNRPTRRQMTSTLVCSKCSIEQPIEDFPLDRSTFSGRKAICKMCYAEYRRLRHEREPDYMMKHFLRSHYGLTVEQLEEMKRDQKGRCAICRKETRLVVDHNHTTGQVRNLLCTGCNTLIGLAYESRDHLLAAIAYLEKWNNQQE